MHRKMYEKTLNKMMNYKQQDERAADLVHEITNISVLDMKNTDRRKHIVEARRMLAYVLRMLGRSYPYIGEFLNKDHTTIIYMVRQFEKNSYCKEFVEKCKVVFPDELRFYQQETRQKSTH